MSGIESGKMLDRLAGMRASEFLLHRGQMLLLNRLVEIGPDNALCDWRVLESNEFAVPGFGVPSYVGVECMAQCIAVLAGARARIRGSSPPLGLLLGTRHYKASVQFFEVGVNYHIACRELIRDEEGMGSFDCQILLDGESVATGRLIALEQQQGKSVNG